MTGVARTLVTKAVDKVADAIAEPSTCSAKMKGLLSLLRERVDDLKQKDARVLEVTVSIGASDDDVNAEIDVSGV